MRLIATGSAILLLALSLAGQQWQRLPSTGHPPKQAFVAMAYDASRDRIVCVADEAVSGGPGFVIGGVTTWEWDGARWLRRVTATTPTAFGMQHAMAYDPTRGRVVLVNRGGETWSFDGVDWQQEPITGPFTVEPSLAFDPTRGVLVLATGSAALHGVYEVVNGAWTQRATFSPAQDNAVIGFDPISARIIAFGGINYIGSPLNVDTTQAWDGTSLTTLAPATVPNGRSEHVLVNAPITGQLLLIGGIAWSPGVPMADVHAWNGTDWVPQPALPTARRHAAAASMGGSLWLFGGRLDNQPLPYSHELLRRDPAGVWSTVPILISGALGAHDGLRARTVSVRNGRTLEFDGYSWTDVGIPFPAATTIMAIAFHAQTARVVAFDHVGSTWLYDGLAWTQAVTPIAPPPRDSAGIAYDAIRNVVVLAGGNGVAGLLSDVWEWNGAVWSNPQPPAPMPAGTMTATWDGQSVVAVQQYPPGTWSWNGTAWTFVATAPIFTFPRLAHDPALGLVMVAGNVGPVAGDATWRFTGGAWQPVPGVGPADPGLGGGPLVFDTNRGQLVLHDMLLERDHVLSTQLATAQTYGTSCGIATLPRLNATEAPQLGAPSISDVDRALAGSFAFLLADLVQANVPLPGGCTALVANPIVLAAAPTNGSGFASMGFVVPPAPALRGIDVFEQALALDPAGTLFGFANLTNGLRLRVGD